MLHHTAQKSRKSQYFISNTNKLETKTTMGHKSSPNPSIQPTYSFHSNVLTLYYSKPFFKNNSPNTQYTQHTKYHVSTKRFIQPKTHSAQLFYVCNPQQYRETPRCKILRWKIQRRQKRLQRKSLATNELLLTERQKDALLNITRRHGFFSDPNKTRRHNFYDALSQLQICPNTIVNSLNIPNKNVKLQLQQPINLTVHNLCHGRQPPLGTKNLLGLGLKYCAVPSKPSFNIKECTKKLAYRICTKQYLLSNNRQSNGE
jgi:hypothetical protein